MNVNISHAACARSNNPDEGRGRAAPFLLGIVISAVIWSTLAFGTMVSVSTTPISEQPTLKLTLAR